MADFRSYSFEYFPDNLLIDIFSYLSVRELVRAGRVCKRWRNLVREQRLWQSVDLSKTKGEILMNKLKSDHPRFTKIESAKWTHLILRTSQMTSRVLWFLLRQYLGRGLRCLRLRGLLLSARGGAFLSESWLQALSLRCPHLRVLSLLHADLRGLHSCLLLPSTLQVLELRGCELPPGFFSQSSTSAGGTKTGNRVGRVSLATTLAGSQTGNRPANTCHKGIAIETLVLDNVPSFTDLHLQSLSSWERLSRLEMRDVIRITAAGLRNCAIREGGTEASGGLSKLTALELGNSGRPGSQTQMASLGLGEGWAGLQELTLGGREVGPGLLCVSRLHDLRHLRLRSCRLSQVQVLRSCRGLHSLRGMDFCEVVFPRHQQNCDGEEEEHGNDEGSDEEGDPVPTLRRALASLLPQCTLRFTRCSVTLSSD